MLEAEKKGFLDSNFQLLGGRGIKLVDHSVTFTVEFLLHPLIIVDFRNLQLKNLHHAVQRRLLVEQSIHRLMEMEDCLEHAVLLLGLSINGQILI